MTSDNYYIQARESLIKLSEQASNNLVTHLLWLGQNRDQLLDPDGSPAQEAVRNYEAQCQELTQVLNLMAATLGSIAHATNAVLKHIESTVDNELDEAQVRERLVQLESLLMALLQERLAQLRDDSAVEANVAEVGHA